MNVELFTVGPLATNCYIVTCDKTRQSVIIDPGGISDELYESVNRRSITSVLLTHGHFDHIEGVGIIAEITRAPVKIHALDASMLTNPQLNGSTGMLGTNIMAPEASELLSDSDEITFGDSRLRVVYTPGHSQGSISFVNDNDFIICGDILFKLSVGRWDLNGGDYATLVNTLHTVFRPMPDKMVVYPGHGESTTIGFEKSYNPFMKEVNSS